MAVMNEDEKGTCAQLHRKPGPLLSQWMPPLRELYPLSNKADVIDDPTQAVLRSTKEIINYSRSKKAYIWPADARVCICKNFLARELPLRDSSGCRGSSAR